MKNIKLIYVTLNDNHVPCLKNRNSTQVDSKWLDKKKTLCEDKEILNKISNNQALTVTVEAPELVN